MFCGCEVVRSVWVQPHSRSQSNTKMHRMRKGATAFGGSNARKKDVECGI